MKNRKILVTKYDIPLSIQSRSASSFREATMYFCHKSEYSSRPRSYECRTTLECHTNWQSPYRNRYVLIVCHSLIRASAKANYALSTCRGKCVASNSHQHTLGRCVASCGVRCVRMRHSHTPCHQIFPVWYQLVSIEHNLDVSCCWIVNGEHTRFLFCAQFSAVSAPSELWSALE